MADGAAILVIGPNWVGDMVMAHGLVSALRAQFPERPIDVLAPPASAPVAERMAEVREVIRLPFSPHAPQLRARRDLAASLRGRYGAAYILPGSWISALVPALAGIPTRIGYLRELRFGLLNRVVAMPRGEKRKTAEAYFRLVGEGMRKPPRLVVDIANQQRLLAGFGLVRGGYAVLLPGAEGGSAKRWPAAHYAELARGLLAEGLDVAILGSPRDAGITAEVAAGAPGVRDLGGRTSLADAIDVVAGARHGVANDSGLMHVAAAVGTPVVGVYGATSPHDTPPLGARSAVVSLGLACSPCNRRECPLGHTNCLKDLAAERVGDAVRALLAEEAAA